MTLHDTEYHKGRKEQYVMKVTEIMAERSAFSFEVFPPKTDVGMDKLCKDGGCPVKVLHTVNSIKAVTVPSVN